MSSQDQQELKKLKLRMSQLEKENQNLTLKLSQTQKLGQSLTKKDALKYSLILNKKALVIQRVVKGFLARKKFLKLLQQLKNQAKHSSKHQSTREALKFVQRQVEKKGFSMEMLFRAVNNSEQKKIQVEEFKNFFERLKLNIPGSTLKRFFYILDESFKGEVSEKDYLQTLVSFAINNEESTKKFEKAYKDEVLRKFYGKLASVNLDLQTVFDSQYINYKEFDSFLDNSLEGCFSEKEKAMLIRLFDVMEQGHIEKGKIIHKIQEQNDQGKFQVTEEQADYYVAEDFKEVALKQKQSEAYVLNLFIRKFRNYNKNINFFTDVLAMSLQSNREKVDCEHNSISLHFLKQILVENFVIILGQDLIDDLINLLFERDIGFRSQFDKQRILKGDKLKNTSIDVVEFKNKLVQLSNCSEDTSKILFVLRAIKLDKQELSTKDFVEKYGYSTQRKIEFSDFFILAQKIVSANFKEVNFMQERYDRQRTGYFSIAPFIDEINQYRLEGMSHSGGDSNKLDSMKKIVKKCKTINTNIIEDFTVFICQKSDNVSQDFEEKDVNEAFTKIFSGKVTKEETESLWSFIDINRNSKVEMFEIIDFFVQNFGTSQDIFKIIVRLTGSFLDSKKITTRNFFANYDLYDENVFQKHIFVKKLEVILGVQESHAQIIFDSLKNNEEKVSFKKFVDEIEKHRKMKSDKVPERKPSAIKMLSKSSLNDLDDNKDQTRGDNKNTAQSQSQINLSLGMVGQSLQQIINQKESEIQALNGLILDYDKEGIPILKVKQFLNEIFDKKETFLLLNFFRSSDTNKNGFIQKEEWKQFAPNIGIKQEKAKKKIPQKPINSDLELYQFIREASKEEVIDVDIEFLHQMSEFENQDVNIVTIKNILRSNYPESDISLLMHLLQYFDTQKNGVIQFNDFKALLILLDTCAEKADWDGELFRRYSLNYDKMTSFSTELNQVDLLSSLRCFVKFMSSEDEVLLGRIISKHFDSTGSLSLSYQDFLEKCNLKKNVTKFDKGIQDQQIVEPLKNLRNALLSSEYNENQISLALAQITTTELEVLKKVLGTDLQKPGQEFRDFVLFFNTSQLMNKSVGKSLFQNKGGHKLSKTKSLLKEDNVSVLDIGLQKLMMGISKRGMEKLKNLINQFFGLKDTQINFSKFVQFTQEITKSLHQDEILKIFQHLDDNESHSVSKNEVIDFLDDNFQEFKKTASHQELSQSVNPSTIGRVNLNMSQAFQNAQKHFQEYQIKPEDCLEGKKTIFTNIYAVMKYTSDLISELSKKNLKFEDPEFGPVDGDDSGAKSLYFEDPIPGGISPDDVIWLRPEQISKDEKPVFLDEGASANDVLQGALGDCWLIGAMSILAQNDDLIYHEPGSDEMSKGILDDKTVNKLITGIYPKIFHSLSIYGIYVYRFFKNFQWIYVIIDDKIPCYQGTIDDPTIVFARCHNRNEFWVPLTEKAFAKLHGNYWALVGGQLDDALVDMTGRIAEKLKVQVNEKFNTKELQSPAEFKKRLNEELNNKSMLGCSIEKGKNVRGEGKVFKNGEFTGLYSGHAYGLMDIIELKKNALIRIRNPWGSGNPIEWNGPWSDQTPELIQNLEEINQQILKKWGKKEAQLVEKENKDGAFLMSWEHFLEQWHNIQICKKFPPSYEGIRFIGEWMGESAGGTPTKNEKQLFEAYLLNPQYILDLSEKTQIFLNLSQEDGRIKSKGQVMFPYQQMSYYLVLLVFKLDPKEEKLMAYDQRRIMNPLFMKLHRDVQFGLDLEKGKYAIVPSTRSIGEEGVFALSIYYGCQSSMIKIFDANTKKEGKPIQEESEDQLVYDEPMKAAVKGFMNI